MNHILQIFTGHHAHEGPRLEDVQDALSYAMGLLDTDDVIFGWSAHSTIYEPMLKTLQRQGKRTWLWMPMFSELPQQYMHHLSYSLYGDIQEGTQVIEGEDFQFVCPSSQENIQNPYDIYQKHFAHLPFDGIFLDKIRHNSFAGGLENGLGCFCPVCKMRFATCGIDVEELRKKITENPAVLLPSEYHEGRYGFADSLIDKFYKCKANWITQAVHSSRAAFQEKGLSVSLDVFAPLLSYLVGQDIAAMSQAQSFIKPMVYRITNAPAGLPFELNALQEALRPYDIDVITILRKLWGEEDLLGAACAKKQIDSVKHSECPIYPGFEINDVPEICDNNIKYVKENQEIYLEMGLDAVVLSWNLLGAPKENLRVLCRE